MVIDKSFIKEYEGLIRAAIWKEGVRDQDEYDEVHGKVIIRILESDNYDEDKGAVSTWVTMITKSVLGNHFKKKVRDPMLNFENLMLNQEARNKLVPNGDPMDKTRLSDVLRKAESVTVEERAIILAYYVGGMSWREIGDNISLSDNAVEIISRKALGRLKEEIQSEL